MTSLRELKKDINYLCSEFIADCYLEMHINSKKEAEIEVIINNVIDSRNELINIISHPEFKHQRNINKDNTAFKKRRKEHRNKINEAFDGFLKVVDEGYQGLTKLRK